jgi:hypothetical protein
MLDYSILINENDFRPYSVEYSLIKNIAFSPNSTGVNIDLTFESKLLICLWD